MFGNIKPKPARTYPALYEEGLLYFINVSCTERRDFNIQDIDDYFLFYLHCALMGRLTKPKKNYMYKKCNLTSAVSPPCDMHLSHALS